MRRIISGVLLLLTATGGMAGTVEQVDGHCPGYDAGEKNVLWGDLHVHTSLSMDAYAIGTRNDPGDAFNFAKGQELTLGDQRTRVKLERPLDFTAVTDHAGFFNVMYVCTDPQFSDDDFCTSFRKHSSPPLSLKAFFNSFLPLVAGDTALEAPFCNQDGINCKAMRDATWPRVQAWANEADMPCEFTAFVAVEWTATPNERHWHRNIIFENANVTEHPPNYVDHPTHDALWEVLERECLAEDGCDVVAIPHNINAAAGGGFDVENASERSRKLRAKYETVAEIHQHKGNSECLAPYGDDGAGDCDFEYAALLPKWSKVKSEDLPENIRNQFRQSYYRTVLARGIKSFEQSGFNPLQLGAIGSTDTHAGTPGAVEEDAFKGGTGLGVSALGRLRLAPNYNPGGLAAVWAEENTRASVFAALKRREVYGTSGPRITLKYSATFAEDGDPCQANFEGNTAAVMGGSLPQDAIAKPRFVVSALKDKTGLARVDIVRGVLSNGEIDETITSFAVDPTSNGGACIAWTDKSYDPKLPAFWYPRVLEQPSKRWSKYDCEELDNCDEFPDMDRMIQERAWASPIWNLP